MDPGWCLLILVIGALLVMWSLLGFAYWLVTVALERNLEKEGASAASSIDALDACVARHPAGRHRLPDAGEHVSWG